MPTARSSNGVRTPPITTARLANGLRAVVVPDRATHVACVAVVYDVGMRAEPPGRTGFAHLVEHLMFAGSRRAAPGGHARFVQGVGGTFNGSTAADRTCFHQVVPPAAVERVLALEADRMAGPVLTPDALAAQRAVVREEVRGKTLHRPYGGFPRVPVSALLFDEFAYAHDGFGSLADLEAATLEDAVAFVEQHYRPRHAVVAVVGDVDPDDVLAAVQRWFGDLPAGASAPAAPRARPASLAADRTARSWDPLAPVPALACAWRVPDPADLAAYLPYVLLADLLGDGATGRLARALVRRAGVAHAVGAGLDLAGDPFDVRDPTGLVATAFLRPGADPAHALRLVDDELAAVAAHGVPADELERLHAVATARTWARVERPARRALAVATALLQRDRPSLPWEVPGLLAQVGPADLRAAAADLGAAPRAVHVVLPGEPGAGPGSAPDATGPRERTSAGAVA
ncbi:M16 family metallopeptidase [Cellulomonas shaoxiangyii]|uniref:Insulinase family protein n=1 Tax=Cellulomonas shaoxiangyii TaxID=2566013 RepID=A0A4P7SQD3_9CELL|nr:pitrilysin family protein [Cellulomonas shaoxiangyii]QCB94973.1 insulinase family protein [Cellulomonas shaoxiangyii]TGY79102.1 insulinase family protein [Cellulomonas shaoxiangyii]